MDILARLEELLKERNWSRYKLSKESGLAEETLTNIFKRGSMPSLTTLQAICNGFQITLSQFFTENETVELTDDLKELFNEWKFLAPSQKEAVLHLMRVMKCDKK